MFLESCFKNFSQSLEVVHYRGNLEIPTMNLNLLFRRCCGGHDTARVNMTFGSQF